MIAFPVFRVFAAPLGAPAPPLPDSAVFIAVLVTAHLPVGGGASSFSSLLSSHCRSPSVLLLSLLMLLLLLLFLFSSMGVVDFVYSKGSTSWICLPRPHSTRNSVNVPTIQPASVSHGTLICWGFPQNLGVSISPTTLCPQ